MKKNLVKTAVVLLATVCLVLIVNMTSSIEMTDEQLVCEYLHKDGRTTITKVEIDDEPTMGDEYIAYLAYEGEDLRYIGEVLRTHAKHIVYEQ